MTLVPQTAFHRFYNQDATVLDGLFIARRSGDNRVFVWTGDYASAVIVGCHIDGGRFAPRLFRRRRLRRFVPLVERARRTRTYWRWLGGAA